VLIDPLATSRVDVDLAPQHVERLRSTGTLVSVRRSVSVCAAHRSASLADQLKSRLDYLEVPADLAREELVDLAMSGHCRDLSRETVHEHGVPSPFSQ